MFGENELFKEVKKISLLEILPEYNFPPGFDHAIVDENKSILNFCSVRYSLVENKNIFLPIEEYFQELDIDYIRSVNIINKSKFYVDYIIKTRKDAEGITGIFPKISVWNSYDGGSMMRHEVGFFRLVSSNNIISPLNQKKDIYRHATGSDSITTAEKVEQIVMDSKEFIKNADKDIEAFVELSKVKATKKKVASIGKAVGLSKKIIACAEERYDLEVSKVLEYKNEYGETVKHSGSGKNLLTVYLSLNFGIYNTNLKELPEKKVERDRKLLLSIIG